MGYETSKHGMRVASVALALAFAVGHAQALPTVQQTLTLGNNTAGIATDPVLGEVYVPNFDDGTLSVVDSKTLAVKATLQVGSSARRLVADAARHYVYVVRATTPGSLVVIDRSGGKPNVTIPVGNNSRAVGTDFFVGRVYVTNTDSNTVSVVDTATNTVVATLPVGAGALTPQSNGTLKKVYVPNYTDGTVTVINESTLTVAKTIHVGNGPVDCTIDGQHAKVYVNNATDKTISVIDSNTDTVIKTVASGTGTSSNFGVVSAVYRRYYLPNQTDGTLTIVNTDTDTVTNTLPVGAGPYSAVVDGVGGDVYVVNHDGNSVTDVSAATEAVLGSFAVGVTPWRMADSLGHLFILNINGNAADTMTIASENNSIANTAIATEFYHKDFNHYFHTVDEAETRVLQDGLFHDDWHRTFQFFRVWSAPGPGRLPVSRFFSTQWDPKSSHFYTANADERNKLVSGAIPGWQLEADAVYYIMLADANGNCLNGTVPLYRMFNNGQGGAPNHSFTTDRATRDAMLAQGWTGEGSGPDTVYGCVPTLTAG